jgi:hypothetical protein
MAQSASENVGFSLCNGGSETYMKNDFLDDLKNMPPFKPCAYYMPEPMDWLVILMEDVSYRSEPTGGPFEILWHPYEDRIVGVKIMAISWFEHGLSILRKAKLIA